jgi:hypothetical protein
MTGPRLAALKHLDCPVIAACSFPASPNIRLSLKATHPLPPFPCVFSLGLFLVVSHPLQHSGSSSSLQIPHPFHHLIPFVHRPSEASSSFLSYSRLGAGPPKEVLDTFGFAYLNFNLAAPAEYHCCVVPCLCVPFPNLGPRRTRRLIKRP